MSPATRAQLWLFLSAGSRPKGSKTTCLSFARPDHCTTLCRETRSLLDAIMRGAVLASLGSKLHSLQQSWRPHGPWEPWRARWAILAPAVLDIPNQRIAFVFRDPAISVPCLVSHADGTLGDLLGFPGSKAVKLRGICCGSDERPRAACGR